MTIPTDLTVSNLFDDAFNETLDDDLALWTDEVPAAAGQRSTLVTPTS